MRKKAPKFRPTEPHGELLLTIPKVAYLLSATIWGVRELIASGKLRAVKTGHAWTVTRTEVEKYVATLDQEAA